MTTNLTIGSFVAQAARLGENSDAALTLNLETGTLGASKVGFFAKRGTAFKAGTYPAWNAFSQSLRASFGANALPPDLERVIAQGKPLTARAIIQITRQTQAAARASAIGGLSVIMADSGSTERGFLLTHSTDDLLDAYVALRTAPLFAAADADDRQLMLADFLREMEARPDDFLGDSAPVGLSGLADGATFTKEETSVEDLTKLRTGALKKGDRIGTISEGVDAGKKRYIFKGLKNKGVEPGFLVTKNWVRSHTNALRGELGHDNPIYVMGLGRVKQQVKAIITGPDKEKARCMLAQLQMFCDAATPGNGQEDRERRFAVNQAIGDGADYGELLERFTEAEIEAFAARALEDPDSLDEFWWGQCKDLVRDAKFYIREHLPEFTETHVIKLDYNESDRTITGKLRLPQRVKESHGGFYWLWRRKTRREVNSDAVAEALANDITRALGIPAQTLKIIRASYPDGTPKLMLDSTYISGTGGIPYRDFDHFIRDGYLDKDLLKARGHPGVIRDLGKHKAAFLLLGDRDAVGSKGQNKGFVGNTFAAIDPGHSLEGSRVDVRDDFSFTSSATSAFHNFTVFDDSPLSEKMAGWDEIERTVSSHAVEQLFAEYIHQFGPEEGELNFLGDIEERVKEFYERYGAMRETLAPRLAIYRGLPGDPPDRGPRLLDTLENVEKLLSKTSPTSPGGEVRLEHLRVDKRVAVNMGRNSEGVTLTCRDLSQAEAMKKQLEQFLKETGRGSPNWTIQDGKLHIPEGEIEAFMTAFTEENVRRFKGQWNAL